MEDEASRPDRLPILAEGSLIGLGEGRTQWPEFGLDEAPCDNAAISIAERNR